MITNGYELAREQISEIAEASNGTVQFHDETTRPSGSRQFKVSIRFDGLERVKGGLPVRAREQFDVIVLPTFPFHYPLGRDTARSVLWLSPRSVASSSFVYI